jgi:hypothetical protein
MIRTRIAHILLLTLAALLLLGLSFPIIYILFFDFEEDLRAVVEGRLRALTGRAAFVGQCSVNIPNMAIAVQTLSIPASLPGPPLLEIDVLRGQIDLLRLATGRFHLSNLHADGVRIHVRDYGKGAVDVGFRPRTRGGGVRLALSAEHALVENATVIYDNRSVPWRFEASSLALNLTQDVAGVYNGRLSFDQGSIRVKDRPAAPASVEAKFEVSEDEITVSSLTASGLFYRLRSEGSVHLKPRLSAAGKPARADFRFEAEAEVGPTARSLFGLRNLDGYPGNRGRTRGSLSAGPGWHELKAAVELPLARFAGIPASGWGGEIHWDRSVLSIPNASGLLAGGPATVRLRQELPAAAHRAALELKFEEASLSSVMQSIAGEPGPLAARLSGSAELDFSAAEFERLNGSWRLAGSAGAEPGAGQRPLRLSAAGSFRNGDLHLAPSTLATDAVTVRIAGSYPRRGPAALDVEAEATELAEADRLQRALRALLYPGRPARLLEMSGAGRASGLLAGQLGGLSFRGAAALQNLTFRGIHLGATEVEGSLTSRGVRFTRLWARNKEGRLRAWGEVSFGEAGFWQRDFELRGTLEGWPAGDVEIALGRNWGLRGSLTGEGRFSRRADGLQGQGSYSIARGALRGQAFEQASGRIELDGQEVRLASLSLAQAAEKLEGSLAARLDGSLVSGQLRGDRVSLSRLPAAGKKLEGEAELRITVLGSSNEPELAIEGGSPDLRLAGVSLGPASLSAQVKGGRLFATVATTSEESRLMASGSYPIGPGGEATLGLQWTDFAIVPLLRALRPALPASLELTSSGEASLSGRLERRETLKAEGRVRSLAIQLADYRMSSGAPFSLSLSDGQVRLAPVRLEGTDTRLELEGSVGLDGTALNVRARGAVNPEILGSFFPNLSASGRAEIVARLVGSLEEPLLSGYGDLERGSLRLKALPQGLGDIHGRLEFDNRAVHFDRVACRFGGAPAELSGRVFLAGLLPEAFEVRGAGRGLRLRYPEGLVATVDADLLLTGTLEEQVLSGRVDVRNALWSREYDVTSEILASRERQANLAEPGPLDNLRLDLQVVAPGSLRVRNSVATIDGTADLQLRGTFSRPALLGRSEASRGELFFMGNRYRLLSGKVDFVDPHSVRPLFDILAETRVRSYQIQLRIVGTADRFHPELTSDPPLRTLDILRLLAGGSERDILLGTEEEEFAGVGVAGILTGRLTQEIGRRAERLFGLDRFSIDPFLVGQIANPTARVTLGKRISRDIAISYSTNLNSTTESIILIEYDPGGAVSWIVSRDETGAFAIDVKFRRRF